MERITSKAELSDLANRFMGKNPNDSGFARFAAFSIPVKGDVAYLARRAEPPFAGFYHAIGGGVKESSTATSPLTGGSTHSNYPLLPGLESITHAAIRKFFEEMCAGQPFPPDSEIGRFKLSYIGAIGDLKTGSLCFLSLLEVPDDLPFNRSKKEVGKIAKLSKIKPGKITPVTAFALELMRNDSRFAHYLCQLPNLSRVKVRWGLLDNGRYLIDYQNPSP